MWKPEEIAKMTALAIAAFAYSQLGILLTAENLIEMKDAFVKDIEENKSIEKAPEAFDEVIKNGWD